MLKWIEGVIFHIEFARYLQTKIQGLTWRKAWGYYCDPTTGDDPIEAAEVYLAKMRRRAA